MNMKTCLITGASGFIGSHLTRRLIDDSWDIQLILRKNSDLCLIEDLKSKVFIHYHNGTIDNMFKIIKKAKPDVVFHLASLALPAHRREDVYPLIKSNIIFGNQLIEAMLYYNVYFLINTNTYWQHFQNKKYSPVCLYAATKQAFQDILQFYIETTKLKTITLELFDTYGRNDPRPKLFNQIKKSLENNQILNMSPGNQLIDIVYIADIIESYVLSAKRIISNIGNKSEVFAISSGTPIPLKKLVNMYLQIIGKKTQINWGGRNYRVREVMEPWDQGNTLPGWKPRVSIEEGIKYMEGI